MNRNKIIARYEDSGIEIPQEFYDADVIDMLASENIYEWNGKKYRFLACCTEPTITMENVEDNKERITFAITSKLKDELVLT